MPGITDAEQGRQVRERQSPPVEEAPPARRSFVRQHPLKAILGLLIVAGLLTGAWMFWRYTQTFESTDDAQIDGHLNAVSARIAGTVTAVKAVENQSVKAGDLLVELDQADYQVSLERAQAALTESQARIRADAPSVPIMATTTQTSITNARANVANAQAGIAAAERDAEAQAARIVQAEANEAKARADLARYTTLVGKDEVSREEFDQRVAAAKGAAAMLASERAAALASQRVVEQRRAQLALAESQLNQAMVNGPQEVTAQRANLELRRAGAETSRSAVDEARLNLSYTRVFAPVSGLIGKKAVEAGQRVLPGQQLFAIVPLEDLWVTANYKENQVLHMHPGQRATIHVDAFERDYDAYIESLPAATSARFSVLPPENASGNYVKVVQRLPVRLRFKPGSDAEHRLRPGMSVVPKVWLD